RLNQNSFGRRLARFGSSAVFDRAEPEPVLSPSAVPPLPSVPVLPAVPPPAPAVSSAPDPEAPVIEPRPKPVLAVPTLPDEPCAAAPATAPTSSRRESVLRSSTQATPFLDRRRRSETPRRRSEERRVGKEGGSRRERAQ